MNREIKFRVCNVDVLQMTKIAKYYNIGYVMRFTGLEDNNGEEVYESDIVGHYLQDGTEVISKILFDSNLSAFIHEPINNDIDGGYAGELFENNNHIEVIGNIYDNPELLETNDE